MDIRSNFLHDIRVITFNLLSPEITSSHFFPTVRKINLDFTKRTERTKKLMQSWIKVNFIICTQEMSARWKDVLEPFFVENEYGFIYDIYSSGKMGVGIAYPLKHYDLIDVNKFTCSQIIEPIYNSFKQLLIKSSDTQSEKILTEFESASESKNTLLSLLLKAKHFGKSINKNLIVSTYHMPCRYNLKYFMCAHIHAIKVHLQDLLLIWNTQYENTLSVIVTGDFNITAKSSEYNYFVGIDIETDSELLDNTAETFIKDLTNLYLAINKNLFGGIKLKSTHKTLHNKEPLYTNICIQGEKHFVECLDYILINDQIDIRSCTVGLSVEDPINTPYPNKLCPSDHLPLSASLRIR